MTLPTLRSMCNVKGFGGGEWLRLLKMVILKTLASARMLKQNITLLKNILGMVICINLDPTNIITNERFITAIKMRNLKTLEINGVTLQYEMLYHNSEYGENTWYRFYLGTTTRTYKKCWLFGKKITLIEPKYVFTIWRDIESKDYTKKQVRGWIEHELELLGREAQIRKGEII